MNALNKEENAARLKQEQTAPSAGSYRRRVGLQSLVLVGGTVGHGSRSGGPVGRACLSLFTSIF